MAVAGLGLLSAGCHCHCPTQEVRPPRAFEFPADTVGFANETRWIYFPDGHGGLEHRRREPAPTYGWRCFVVSRLNRQFFDHAVFAPDLPPVTATELRARVREVVSRSARCPSAAEQRVVFPGFRDLRHLSLEEGESLRALGGGAAESYVQRGHWRMLLPFSRAQQGRVAESLLASLASGRPRILHLVRFPQLTINHAVLAFDGWRTPTGMEFATADPNDPGQVWTLTFDAADRSFHWPAVPYFGGGRVDVYEVYRGAWY